MCINCKDVTMKYLILSLSLLLSTITVAKTPQDVLREEGYVLVSKESGKEVYYRPKEVKKHDAIACKEKKVIRLGVHNVPYIGKASYTDFTKKGIKETSIKPYQTNTDRVMASKLCR